MLYQRHKLLLTLLSSFGGRLNSLDFQKLLFLYCQEWQEVASYEFVPYRFGGFSFTSYADKRKLIEKEFLINDEKAWELADQGRKAIINFPTALKLRLKRFATSCADLRGDRLVTEIYRRYPWTATRSEIAQRLLKEDVTALKRIQDSVRSDVIAGICTIGYEGKSLEGYLNVLLLNGVNLLCDVRKNPLSRKYGFSKGVLSSSCEKVGIRYEHLPELGISSDRRQELHSQDDYDNLFDHYEKESLPKQEASLTKIQGWVIQGYRVALTCFELHPHQCHRHCVAEALENNFGIICQPKHL